MAVQCLILILKLAPTLLAIEVLPPTLTDELYPMAMQPILDG